MPLCQTSSAFAEARLQHQSLMIATVHGRLSPGCRERCRRRRWGQFECRAPGCRSPSCPFSCALAELTNQAVSRPGCCQRWTRWAAEHTAGRLQPWLPELWEAAVPELLGAAAWLPGAVGRPGCLTAGRSRLELLGRQLGGWLACACARPWVGPHGVSSCHRRPAHPPALPIAARCWRGPPPACWRWRWWPSTGCGTAGALAAAPLPAPSTRWCGEASGGAAPPPPSLTSTCST